MIYRTSSFVEVGGSDLMDHPNQPS